MLRCIPSATRERWDLPKDPGHSLENGWRDPVKNQERKTEPVEELKDELLEAVSGGTDSTETNLQDDTIQDEVMLIIPIV